MPRIESDYPQEWLRIAEKDYARVTALLEMHDSEAAGFFLQQALEKFLKGFLLSHGWRLQRLHDLEPLLNAAIPFDPSFERFRSVLQTISGFYFVDRYPFVLVSGITEEDIRRTFTETTQLIAAIRAHFQK